MPTDLEYISDRSNFENDSEQSIAEFFYNCKFRFIDAGNRCKLDGVQTNNPTGQIDALYALDDDYLFMIEVKNKRTIDTDEVTNFFEKWSTETFLTRLKEKYHIPHSIKPIRIIINYKTNQQFDSELVLRYLQPGKNNYYLTHKEIEKFMESVSNVFEATKYDFLAYLKIEKPGRQYVDVGAMRIKLASTPPIYVFSATANQLIENCYVFRCIGDDGYQRAVKFKRVKNIAKYILATHNIVFPNSIIVKYLRSTENDKLNFTPYNSSEYNADQAGVAVGKLAMPTSYLSFRVIDGQHRLLGFTNVSTSDRANHNLIVVAYENLNDDDEMGIFIDINSEQKKINPNLIEYLISRFEINLDHRFFDRKIAAQVIIKLNETRSSPVYKSVYLGYNDENNESFHLKTFSDALIRNQLIGGKTILQSNRSDIETPTTTLSKYLTEVKTTHPRIWANNPVFSFKSDRGIRVLCKLIQLYELNKKSENISVDFKELMDSLSTDLTDSFFNNLKETYGEGGAGKTIKEIVKKIKAKRQYRKFKQRFRGGT